MTGHSTRWAVRFWAGTALALQTFLVVCVVLLGFYALQTNNTLCDFKRSIQVRYDNTVAYVTLLEEGVRRPPPGITIEDIRADLAARRATLDSLSDLSCS